MTSGTEHELGIYDSTTEAKTSHGERGMSFLKNVSGGNLVTADVGVVETTGDKQFTTTTTSRDLRKAVVVPQSVSGNNVAATRTIGNNEEDWVWTEGYVQDARVNGQVTWGECLILHSTAKELVGTDVQMGSAQGMPLGTQAIALADQAATGNIPIYLLPAPILNPAFKQQTSAPGVNDDVTLGYTPGSIIVDTTGKQFYGNIANTDGAAEWRSLSGYTEFSDSAPSSAASVDVQSIPATGGDLVITGFLRPATDDVGLHLRLNNRSGASDYAWVVYNSADPTNDTADAQLKLVSGLTANFGVGNAATEGVEFEIRIPGYANTDGSIYKMLHWTGFYVTANGGYVVISGGGIMLFSEAISRVTLLFESGNIASGRVRVFITAD